MQVARQWDHDEEKGITFWCPGCAEFHTVTTHEGGWQWNGDLEKVTLSPSILVRGTKRLTDEEHAFVMNGGKIDVVQTVCHSFVKEGQIQFLADCTHDLASQTVALPPHPAE